MEALIATWALQRDEPGALEQVIAARDRAEAIGDLQTVGWLSTSLISGLRWAKRYEEGIEVAEAAIRLHAELASPAHEAICKGNLGTLLLELDAIDEAFELFDEAVVALREAAWPAAEAAFLCGRSEARARRGEDGASDVAAAIDILEQRGRPTDLASAWVQRGSLALHRGDRAAAEQALRRATEVAGGRTAKGLEHATTALRRRLDATGSPPLPGSDPPS